jgi:integrase
MGGIYTRGSKLWIWYFDADGKRLFEPTSSRVGEEARARKTLDAIERRVEAEKRTGVPAGELTVKAYGERWLRARPGQGIVSAKDDQGRLRLHAWPIVGHILLKDLRPHHVRDMVRALRMKKSSRGSALAPRTIRHVNATLRVMLQEAVIDELIPANPCVFKRGELPQIADKDPNWRAGAVFARGEVEQLISDQRIPEQRRVFNALVFLTGLRTGEVSALRWRSYDSVTEPLGRLQVSSSYSTRLKEEKAVKTKRPREVPVHRTLASILGAWKVGGWERSFGRAPQPDDLLVPAPANSAESSTPAGQEHLTTDHTLDRFYEDCETLGLRRRRQYDSRRTFISLSLADGARKDILRWVTHGATGDIVDAYTTLPWASLCDEVSKFKVDLREGKVLPFQKVAAAACDSPCDSGLEPKQEPPRKQPRGFKISELRGLDLNQRPSGYEPDELPGCSTPR